MTLSVKVEGLSTGDEGRDGDLELVGHVSKGESCRFDGNLHVVVMKMD